AAVPAGRRARRDRGHRGPGHRRRRQRQRHRRVGREVQPQPRPGSCGDAGRPSLALQSLDRQRPEGRRPRARPGHLPARRLTAAPVAGAGNAQALTQMGFANLIEHMTVVNWIVFIVLILMSVLSVYWIIYNFIKNIRLKSNSDRVIATFWETPNAQDAIRFME